MDNIKLGKQIYTYLLEKAGGEPSKINGLSRMERIRMQDNKSNMTWGKTKELLAANGVHSELTLYADKGSVTFNLE